MLNHSTDIPVSPKVLNPLKIKSKMRMMESANRDFNFKRFEADDFMNFHSDKRININFQMSGEIHHFRNKPYSQKMRKNYASLNSTIRSHRREVKLKDSFIKPVALKKLFSSGHKNQVHLKHRYLNSRRDIKSLSTAESFRDASIPK